MNRIKSKKTYLCMAITIGFFCMVVVPAYSATYYVRTDGGTASQCTGLTDAPYPGSGENQPCAFEHPNWAISLQGMKTTKMKGGDTLIIDGSNSAEYMMGLNSPNSRGSGSKCGGSWPWDCYMRPIPSGPDPTRPTRILGKGWDQGCPNPPQLWANERADTVINLRGTDNFELQCLEITDHSSCQSHGPVRCNRSSKPYGPWGPKGIVAQDSTNGLIKNVNIHGMASKGIHAGRLKDWTMINLRIYANSFVGWDGDIGADKSSNSGTIAFIDSQIQYSGCGETYPGLKPHHCYSQDQGGYGDGLGTHNTAGNWIFDNVDFSHNVSDGIDLLYHQLGGTITIKRSRFEGNAGNQVKVAGSSEISDSVLIGNCAYFKNKDITCSTANNCDTGFNNCRAGGNTLSMRLLAGTVIKVTNSTITGNGDSLMSAGGNKCNLTEKIITRNNIFLGGKEYHSPGDKSDLFWANGSDGNGAGPCGQVVFDDDYSVIWNTKHFDTKCVGKEHSMCENPKLREPEVEFYAGEAYDAHLQSTSPAIGKGVVLTGQSSLDFAGNERGDVWDIGAIEYDIGSQDPTCADSIDFCLNEADCVAQAYYWYDDACHVDPEPLPTCGDDIQYCTNSLECTQQGYYWYDNACHLVPESSPTCADGIQYCTTSAECAASGYYWYNNTCNLLAQSQPTCADGIQYCTNSATCQSNGYYWYNDACHAQPESPVEECVPIWCDLPLIECGQPPLTGGTDSCGNPCTKPSAEWPSCVEPEPTCADGIQYCTNSSDCTQEGYHWYNNTCNLQPEPKPTCADGIQYCLTPTDCSTQGYYWYNNICHVEPEPLPTCADGLQYCTVPSDCVDNGYYWYDGTCHLEPEPLPTCADGIQYCTNQSDCTSEGYHWYDDTCNLRPQPLPTCADGIQYCASSDECQANGYYWYNNICHIEPEPLPTCADGIQYCANSSDCTKQGYHWYNNTCNLQPEPKPTCADGIEYCLTSTDCIIAGHFWYDNACHLQPKPQPTCADGIQYCTNSSDCTQEGYHWYNNTCNLQPEPKPTCADGIQFCTKKSDCTKEGYHWYDDACHAQPEPEPEPTCADGIQYCLTQTECEAQNYYWYDNQCHKNPKPVPQAQQQDVVSTTQTASNVPEEPDKPEEEEKPLKDESPEEDDKPSDADTQPSPEIVQPPFEDVFPTKDEEASIVNVINEVSSTAPLSNTSASNVSSGGSTSGGFAGVGGGGGSSSNGRNGSSKGKVNGSLGGSSQSSRSASKGGSSGITQGRTGNGGSSSPVQIVKKDVPQDSNNKVVPTLVIQEPNETTEISEISQQPAPTKDIDSQKEVSLDPKGESFAEVQNKLLTSAPLPDSGEEGYQPEREDEVGEEDKGVITEIKENVQEFWENVIKWFAGFGA